MIKQKLVAIVHEMKCHKILL